MSRPKVSLVFPCWHAAQHMQHVLEDLQAQTFKDFEVIMVNDGDNGQVEAMEAIAAQDSRIRIINLPQNRGVAAARNAGTDAVTSEWVTYPDSDDRIGPNYVKSLYEAVDGAGVEMACGGFTMFYASTGKYENHFIKINNSPVMGIVEGYEQIMPLKGTVWNRLYNMEIIRSNRLRQDVNFKTMQDCAFNMTYYPFVKQVGLVNNCDYIYYSVDYGTNGSRYNYLYLQNYLKLLDLQENFHRQIGWSELQVIKKTDKDISYRLSKILQNYYAIDSPLSIGEITKIIEFDLLGNSRIVKAILQQDYGNDYLMRLLQYLVRIDNARLIALTFKVFVAGKRRWGSLYYKIKPFFRGE